MTQYPYNLHIASPSIALFAWLVICQISHSCTAEPLCAHLSRGKPRFLSRQIDVCTYRGFFRYKLLRVVLIAYTTQYNPIESNYKILRYRGNISCKSLCSKGLGCAYKTCTHLHFLHTLRHNVTLGSARNAFVPMIVKHRWHRVPRNWS